MSNQTMGITVPQNESVDLLETLTLNINTDKDELNSVLQKEWIKFINSIDDNHIEKFLETFGIRKKLPYLQFLTLRQFIEDFKFEFFNELSEREGIKIKNLVLYSETILAYCEYQENGSLANILRNGYDSEFDSLIELIEFDVDKFISDYLREGKNNDSNIS